MNTKKCDYDYIGTANYPHKKSKILGGTEKLILFQLFCFFLKVFFRCLTYFLHFLKSLILQERKNSYGFEFCS